MTRVAIALLLAAIIATPALAQDTTRLGAVSLAYVARNSKAGKTELARIEEASRKHAAEIDARSAELQKQQAQLQQAGAGLSARALSDLQRAFERSRIDLQRFQEDARNEIESMTAEFEVRFRARLAPLIDEVSNEKGLQFVFGLEQAAIVWWSPAVDISDDVVKRLDAGAK